MNTVARARFVRVSARKARLVLDQIRGKSGGDALATLEETPRPAAAGGKVGPGGGAGAGSGRERGAGPQGGRGEAADGQSSRARRTQAQGEEIGDGSEDASDRLPPRLHAHVVVALVRDEELRGPAA